MTITTALKEEIKRRNPIKDVLADYGYQVHNGKTSCPFHQDDDDPSFQVYEKDDPAEDNYFCYGCGAGKPGELLKVHRGSEVFEVTDQGSDVIGLVANYEQISFTEASKYLMVRAGIPIPIENPQLEKAKDAVTEKNRTYWHTLRADSSALQYLYDRGLDDQDIADWRLGLVPFNDPQKHLRGRLVFGLAEHHFNPNAAKTIAMAYRTLQTNEKPKYINDPTSSLYQKKYYLYGLHRAIRAIRRRGYAIVVEGYFDVIMAHRHGFENTVGTCGTAFTIEQMGELRKLTDKIILWYDGDNPGREAMERVLPDLLEKGFSVQFVSSDGFDPAEMFQRADGNSMTTWLQRNARPAVQVMIDRMATDYQTVVHREKVRALDKLLPILQKVERPSDKLVYENYLKQRFNL